MYIGSRPNRRLRGISLIESLAAVTVLAVGMVAVMGGLGAMSRTEVRVRQVRKMTSLAQHKFDELIAITATLNTAQNGDFKDQNNNDFVWSATVDQTGSTNLVAVTVTVSSATDTSQSAPTGSVTGLVYQPPTANTTTTGATP